jgi:predicted transcriptional regulator
MRLTDKEMEIMAVLWKSKIPLTASEIIESSGNRTWKENSIYIIMNSLLKKEAVKLALYKPTNTNNARAYEPTLTSEEYMAANIGSVRKTGINVDIKTLIKHLKEAEEG